MHAKLSILALAAAASVQEVCAGPIHRHKHPKKDIVYAYTDVVVVTEWVTHTVIAGHQPTEAPVVESPSIVAAPVEAPAVESSPSADPTSENPLPPSSTSAEAPAPETPAPESSPAESPAPESTPAESSPAPSSSEIPPSPSSSEAPPPSTTSSEAAPPTTSSEATPAETQTPADPAPPASTEAPVLSLSAVLSLSVVPSSSAASSSSAAAVPSSSAASTVSKRGAAYNDPNLVSALVGQTDKISWAYNWGSDSGGLQAKISYYPMLWSPASDHSSNWDEKAEAAIASGSDSFLSFNEPDISSQANLSPQDAATAHKQFMNKYAGRVKISSPAISSSDSSGMGIDWLNQFFDACDGQCQVDFCAAHWYGPGGDDGASLFLDHIKKVYDACQGKPVWVTEFAATDGDIDQFMTSVTQGLDSDEFSFVEKYSYFMVNEGSLMSSATDLSSFGKIFAGI
ncbi:glycosyl hydrolase catalytic core-domain-containing protein [Daldinia vernicosa]|uniref:glycosyl hydrolase catalytic core-domain-containing protein n=1 Tax=Daldinia vernicosa TaxID=114800 RepID=UPI00200804BA|nr:glycosyl hydrolase catalytic core-domain-containing protein [Daldinia vernicosa]KAI0845751.1 glycosyl hydrolase catalytic core-domain-containing protein [Daldinia vernicosa]